MSEWQPIDTAPEAQRIYVCGYAKASGRTEGYWWWEEGMVFRGKDPANPGATHWTPIILPDFPPPPAD